MHFFRLHEMHFLSVVVSSLNVGRFSSSPAAIAREETLRPLLNVPSFCHKLYLVNKPKESISQV